MGREPIICDVCGKEFTSTRSSFRKHQRLKHGRADVVQYNAKCREAGCQFAFCALRDLRTHLEAVHELHQEVIEMEFADINEFHKWKAMEENRCLSTWIKGSAVTKKNEATVYYYCKRSGKKRTVAPQARKRRTKLQGSCKIDFFCTSAMTVKVSDYDSVKVTYFKTHYGHDNRVEYIPIPEDVKSIIAAQLKEGIPAPKILNNIKESIHFERAQMLTRKDIYNIAREYSLTDATPRKFANKIAKINSNHTAAVRASNMLAIQFQDGWKVVSDGKCFSINSNELNKSHVCKLKCAACDACVHAYTCSCMEFALSTMCKHIHKVCMSDTKEKREENDEKIEVIRDEIRKNINLINLMSDWSDISDPDLLNQIYEHLKVAFGLITGDDDGQKEIRVTVTPVKHEQLQLIPATTLGTDSADIAQPVLAGARTVAPQMDTSGQVSTTPQTKYRPILPLPAQYIVINNVPTTSVIPTTPILNLLPNTALNILTK